MFPVPAEDPNDPLQVCGLLTSCVYSEVMLHYVVVADGYDIQWPKSKKISILVLCSLYSFLGNSSLLGPSVYLGIWAGEFGIDINTSAGLINYANLSFGFGRFTSLHMIYSLNWKERAHLD